MNTKHFISRMGIIAVLVVLVLGFSTVSASATPAGTAFTYQGQLTQGGSAVTGSCNFKFSLWDALTGGSQVAGTTTLELTGVAVTNGLFTVQLDFGLGAFTGEARWLEIGVKCAGDSGYTTLKDRQPLTPAPYALYAGDGPFWNLTGNGGTNPVTNFLGTLDNVALEIRVNNSRALRLEPNATSPNILGGYSGNIVTSGVVGAVISGGGRNSYLNRVTDDYGVVGGGAKNQAGDNAGTTSDQAYAIVGGGYDNTASGHYSTVGGGAGNNASGSIATVGGGYDNNAIGNAATIGGGNQNTASGAGAFIGGGGYDGVNYGGNSAAANAATIGGGEGNKVNSGANYATVGGGDNNTASGGAATVGGGNQNTASGAGAYIGGGGYDGTNYGGNTAAGNASTIGGGFENNVNSGAGYGTVGGGENNTASGYSATISGGVSNLASGMYATIGGGYGNTASGFESTVAGGFRAVAPLYGEMAHASGDFATAGDAQASEYVLRNTTTDAAQTELFLNGASQRLTPAIFHTLSFDILIVAQSDNGWSAGYHITGLIRREDENIGFIGTPSVTVLGEDISAWNAVVVADSTNDALTIRVTGAASTNIHWVASVRTVEVGW